MKKILFVPIVILLGATFPVATAALVVANLLEKKK